MSVPEGEPKGGRQPDEAVRFVAVIDIGKTNVKLALVNLDALREIEVLTAPNRPGPGGPYPHHDVDAIWTFLIDGLATISRRHRIDAVSVTAHGATAALVKADGTLALPVLDYEHGGPDETRARYEHIRPPFEETGSPLLPAGLNVGAQLFWQAKTFPDAFKETASILTYPQYWSWRLTGVVAGEDTSLGCHTDLWNPLAGKYSSLVERMGWQKLFPPIRSAGDKLGPVLPDLALRAGLGASTPVLCGIHDSNASLFPHLLSRQRPFAVISTGTWVVSMAVSGKPSMLDPARDTLVNVDALGGVVPSARFMGGREFERATGGIDGRSSERDVKAVFRDVIMLMPSLQQGSGPFPRARSQWLSSRTLSSGETMAAASFYLALMSATCLDLIGAEGEIVVEGPFAENQLYLRMLGAATGRPVLLQAEGRSTGASIGAALLAGMSAAQLSYRGIDLNPDAGLLRNYAARWAEAVREL